MFEASIKRRQYAEALRALVDQHIGECSAGYTSTLVAARRLADVLEAGKLTHLRSEFRLINKRINCTPTSLQAAEQDKILRKKVRVMRQTAKEHTEDDELAELAYNLETVNKVLGIDPKWTTLLLDRKTRGSYGQLFHEVVIAAIDTVLPAVAPRSLPERQSA